MHRRLAKVAQRISREEERWSRSAKLKRQEACAKILHATAGTEAKGGRQPLSARDMDMGMGTRRMLCLQWLQLSDLSADGILAPSHREV